MQKYGTDTCEMSFNALPIVDIFVVTTTGLSPAKIKCWLYFTKIWFKVLNYVAIVAFYSCIEEKKDEFVIQLPVGKA